MAHEHDSSNSFISTLLTGLNRKSNVVISIVQDNAVSVQTQKEKPRTIIREKQKQTQCRWSSTDCRSRDKDSLLVRPPKLKSVPKRPLPSSKNAPSVETPSKKAKKTTTDNYVKTKVEGPAMAAIKLDSSLFKTPSKRSTDSLLGSRKSTTNSDSSPKPPLRSGTKSDSSPKPPLRSGTKSDISPKLPLRRSIDFSLDRCKSRPTDIKRAKSLHAHQALNRSLNSSTNRLSSLSFNELLQSCTGGESSLRRSGSRSKLNKNAQW